MFGPGKAVKPMGVDCSYQICYRLTSAKLPRSIRIIRFAGRYEISYEGIQVSQTLLSQKRISMLGFCRDGRAKTCEVQ